MKPILETIIFIVSVLAPVSIMLAAAWLIYSEKTGWGWYLAAALIVVAATRIKFDGFSS